MNGVLEPLSAALRQSALWGVLALGAVMLCLFIPIAWIRDLITERMVRRDQAVEEVSAKWGRQQEITGPALVVPYAVREASGNTTERTASHLTILPDQLR